MYCLQVLYWTFQGRIYYYLTINILKFRLLVIFTVLSCVKTAKYAMSAIRCQFYYLICATFTLCCFQDNTTHSVAINCDVWNSTASYALQTYMLFCHYRVCASRHASTLLLVKITPWHPSSLVLFRLKARYQESIMLARHLGYSPRPPLFIRNMQLQLLPATATTTKTVTLTKIVFVLFFLSRYRMLSRLGVEVITCLPACVTLIFFSNWPHILELSLKDYN